MDALRNLIQGANEDRRVMAAAAVVAQANIVLKEEFQLEPDLALATTYADGQLAIETFHGSVAARIESQREVILQKIRQRVERVFVGQRLPIQRVQIRRR